tara:strand:- start:2584 stop:3027 length:444 start_codon:yes stop_codon:yes gene_type:complete
VAGGLVLNSDFPVVEGKYQFTKFWNITLPSQFNRRIEDQDMVIWKPGFTIYLAVWNNDRNLSRDDLFAEVIKDIAIEAFDINLKKHEKMTLFSYRLNENMGDQRVAALYCYAVSADDFVQSVMYLDNENDVELAVKIWESFKFEIAL